MGNIFFILAIISIVVVVGSLVFGLISMSIGSEKHHKISQLMMRLRITSQAFAIVFLLLAFLTKA